jgi:hypothetical protein
MMFGVVIVGGSVNSSPDCSADQPAREHKASAYQALRIRRRP